MAMWVEILRCQSIAHPEMASDSAAFNPGVLKSDLDQKELFWRRVTSVDPW